MVGGSLSSLGVKGGIEVDPDVFFMYDPEVFIQRSPVKGNLYGTSLVYGTWLAYVTLSYLFRSVKETVKISVFEAKTTSAYFSI